MSGMNISNNFFDAELSLFIFNGFYLKNSDLKVEITNSIFSNNNFSIYGNILEF